MALKISLGQPKWDVGYTIHGEVRSLLPFGLLKKHEKYEPFKAEYFMRLDRVGVDRIRAEIRRHAIGNKPIVLLCFEDIRKGPDNWCHRTAFAEWWRLNTGEEITELPDPSKFVPLITSQNHKEQSKAEAAPQQPKPQAEQLSMFGIGGSIYLSKALYS